MEVLEGSDEVTLRLFSSQFLWLWNWEAGVWVWRSECWNVMVNVMG